MSDTKQAFYENFKKPIPPVYNTVIQELLVQQHLLRWNSTYQYDEVCSSQPDCCGLPLPPRQLNRGCNMQSLLWALFVCSSNFWQALQAAVHVTSLRGMQVFALGFVSVFDQIVEGLPGSGASDIFEAYVKALQEDPEQYRRCRPITSCHCVNHLLVIYQHPACMHAPARMAQMATCEPGIRRVIRARLMSRLDLHLHVMTTELVSHSLWMQLTVSMHVKTGWQTSSGGMTAWQPRFLPCCSR